MPIVVPSTSNNAQNGQPDSYFIGRVRRILRDNGVYAADKLAADGTTGALTPGAKPFKLTQPPVLPFTVLLTVPGGPWIVDFDDVADSPATGHVNVITDTGELIFNPAPGAGTLAVTYKHARYSDTQILDALREGMQLLWPEIWNPQTDTTTVQVSPTQFEYPLSAIFQDQRVVILNVEYSPPSGFIRYIETSMWHQLEDIANPTIIFSELPPIASTVRVTYCTTFQQLALVPSQAQHLPVYYAVMRLLVDQETASRNDAPPTTSPAETSSPAGTSLSAAAFWLERFKEQLTKLALDAPARRTIQNRTVERLGLSNFWTDAA